MMYAGSRPACERKGDEFILRFKKTDQKIENAGAMI